MKEDDEIVTTGRPFMWRGEERSGGFKVPSAHQERRAKGLCVRCSNPARPGKSRCAECQRKQSKDSNERIKKRRRENPAFSTCKATDVSNDMRIQVERALEQLAASCKGDPSAGYVYTLLSRTEGLIKIGKTDQNDPALRLAALQTQNAGRLELLSLCHGAALERDLQKKYADSHDHGEWFRIDEDPLTAPTGGMCMGCAGGFASADTDAEIRTRLLRELASATKPTAISILARAIGVTHGRLEALMLSMRDAGEVVEIYERAWDGGKRNHPMWVLAGRGDDLGGLKVKQAKEAIRSALATAEAPLGISALSRASGVDPSQVRRWIANIVADGEAVEAFPPRADGLERLKPLYVRPGFELDAYVDRWLDAHPDRTRGQARR